MATKKATKSKGNVAPKAAKAANVAKAAKAGDADNVVPIKKATKTLPWLKSEEVKWRRVGGRLVKLLGRMERAQEKLHNPDLVDAIDSAKKGILLLDETANLLAEGDDAYKPQGVVGSGGGKKKPEIGSMVCLTEKAREKYEGLLEESEFVDLKVLKVKGSTLIVRALATEEKFKVPRGQVRVQDAQV